MQDGEVAGPSEHDAPTFDQRSLLTARYAEGAELYAQLWAPVIGRVSRRLLTSLPLADARRVVDVGTGTGHLLPHLRRAAPDATVLGVDLTFGMVRQAAHLDGISVAVMDARQLGLRAASIDVVVSAFMLFHVPRPADAVDQIARILHPGGWVATATWGPRHTTRVQARVAELLEQEGLPAEQPAVEDSSEQLDTPDKLRSLLSGRFVDIRSWVVPLDHQWEPDRLLDLLTGYGTVARRLRRLAPRRREAVAAELESLVITAPASDLLDSSEVVLTVSRRR